MKNFKKANQSRSYYFFNDIKSIDPYILRIDKIYKGNTDVVVYSIKYIMMESINSEVRLCLSFSDVDAYIIEENGNKHLIFTLTKNNKKVLELYKKLWSKIKKQVNAINSNASIKYKNNFMKIRLDSYDDDLPLGKVLCFSILNIVVESVFQIKKKYYP